MTPQPTEPDLSNGLSEQEIDANIASLAKLSEKAMKDGDPVGARIWNRKMYQAIASRSPQHKARLEREALERLDSLTFGGEWAQKLGVKCDVPAAAVRRRAGGTAR